MNFMFEEFDCVIFAVCGFAIGFLIYVIICHYLTEIKVYWIIKNSPCFKSKSFSLKKLKVMCDRYETLLSLKLDEVIKTVNPIFLNKLETETYDENDPEFRIFIERSRKIRITDYFKFNEIIESNGGLGEMLDVDNENFEQYLYFNLLWRLNELITSDKFII